MNAIESAGIMQYLLIHNCKLNKTGEREIDRNKLLLMFYRYATQSLLYSKQYIEFPDKSNKN